LRVLVPLPLVQSQLQVLVQLFAVAFEEERLLECSWR